MNLVILCGRLTRDPESRYSTNGMAITRYSIAVDRRKKDDQQPTDFFNITAFGKAAEFAANYFKQGMRVLIQGRIQTGSYTNKDGIKVNTFDIIADNQEFADGNKQSGQKRPRKQEQEDDFITVSSDDGFDIPF